MVGLSAGLRYVEFDISRAKGDGSETQTEVADGDRPGSRAESSGTAAGAVLLRGLPARGEIRPSAGNDRPHLRPGRHPDRPLPPGVFQMSAWLGFRPEFKLWISCGAIQGIFGDGKHRLLSAVRDTGSLTLAARQLGMSYRTAWGDLQKAETYLGFRLVHRQRGGRGGGATRLTAAGTQLLAGYAGFRRDVAAGVRRAFHARLTILERRWRPARYDAD
jgi:molybdate transport system regulatory protein